MERELLPCLRKLKIRFYAYNPLQGGLLVGKLKESDLPTNGRFRPDSVQGQKYRARFWKSAYFEAISLYKSICEKFGLSTVDVALRWIVHHSKLDFEKGDGFWILI